VFLDAKHVVGASTWSWRSSLELDLRALTFCARTAGLSSRNVAHAIVPTARGIQHSKKIYYRLASLPVRNAWHSVLSGMWKMVTRSEILTPPPFK
jgi:hypothetical protein